MIVKKEEFFTEKEKQINREMIRSAGHFEISSVFKTNRDFDFTSDVLNYFNRRLGIKE